MTRCARCGKFTQANGRRERVLGMAVCPVCESPSERLALAEDRLDSAQQSVHDLTATPGRGFRPDGQPGRRLAEALDRLESARNAANIAFWDSEEVYHG